MRKVSATDLGRLVGLDSKEVNKKLNSLGLIKGNPGDWLLTEKGKEYGVVRSKSNGYGGLAARFWSYIVWDRKVARMIGDPDKHLKEVNENRRRAGMDPLDSLIDD